MRKLPFIFFVLLIPCISVSAQTGVLSLPTGKNAIGLGIQYYDPPSQLEQRGGNYQHRFGAYNIRGSLDYQFSKTLKVSFIPGIALLNIASQPTVDIPPSPSAELRLTATGPLTAEKTLDYFVRGAFRSHYTQIHSAGRALHYVNMTFTGGIGIIGRLWPATEWQFHPFFGSFYSQIWRNTSTTREIFVNDTYNLFTGEAGLK